MDAMTIGDLSKRAGVAPKTIRFYEDRGLLPRPRRSEAGYRLYGYRDLRRVSLIRQARALGFSLTEARKLLAAAEHLDCASFEGEVAREAARKLAEVDGLITRLTEVRGQLQGLASRLSGAACGSDCQAPALSCCDALAGPLEPATGREVTAVNPGDCPCPDCCPGPDCDCGCC